MLRSLLLRMNGVATVGRTQQVPSNPLMAPPPFLLLLSLDQLCTEGVQVAGGWAALTSLPLKFLPAPGVCSFLFIND